MKRVEEIKGKRQAQYIFDRQKKARQIEKEKDIKEVKRDLALIRSPAAGKLLHNFTMFNLVNQELGQSLIVV
jgi:hypothetical protein